MTRRDDNRRHQKGRGRRPEREPLPGEGIGFWLRGTDLAPEDDPAWLELPKGHPGRRAFWEHAAELGLEFYAQEREKGRSAQGRKLRRLSEKTIENRESAMGTADPKAPPLIPAHGLSRTVSLLRYSIRKDGLWFYWAHDEHTGSTWGRILFRHKTGWDVPKRDVIGLGKRVRNSIRSRALKWWLLRRKTYSPDMAAEVDWKPSGPGREFFRPTHLDRMDGAKETDREGWYQDVAGKKGRKLTPWQETFRRQAREMLESGEVEYSLAGTNRIRAELGLPALSGPAETPRPKLRLVRPPRPGPITPPEVIRPPAITPPEVVMPEPIVPPLAMPEPIPPRLAPEPASGSLPSFGRSKATVVLPDDTERREALKDAMANVMQGEVVPPSGLASLIGAPDNATVYLTGEGNTLRFQVVSPDLERFDGRLEVNDNETSLSIDALSAREGEGARGVLSVIRDRMAEGAKRYPVVRPQAVVNRPRYAPAMFIRHVQPGERITDLISSGKAATWEDGVEYAVVRLAGAGPGRAHRVIVSGGRDGITFIKRDEGLFFEMEGRLTQVKRIIAHTHPRASGTSEGDHAALAILGQSRSYVIEIGGEPSGTLFRPKR